MSAKIIKSIQSHKHYPKAIDWLKILSVTAGTQILIQIVAFGSGIIIIRELSVEEYGIYSLMNMVLSTMIVLSDAGISTTIMAKGGAIWQDKRKLGIVLNSGLELRKKIAQISLIIAIPILCFLLYQNKVSFYIMPLLVLVLVPSYFSGLSNSILQTAPKLAQKIWPLQKNQLIMNALRLALIIGLVFFFPYAWVAILIAGLPQIISNIQLRKISNPLVDWSQEPSKQVQSELVSKIKYFLPESLYYCFSGQIIIWIVSFAGNATSVAQISALGRLSAALAMIGVVFNTIIKPRFARMAESRQLLLSRYLRIISLLIIMFLFIIAVAYLFPSECIWILGDGYQNLEKEFVLNTINVCIALLAGLIFSIYTSRAWVIQPLYTIAINLFAIILGVFCFDLTNLAGLIIFNIFLSSVQLILNFTFGLVKILKLEIIK